MDYWVSADLFDPWHHSNAGWYRLECLSQSDQRRCAEVGHILAFNVHHLVAGLQASKVGTTALHHGQDVAGPGATQSEAKRLWPVLIGGWEAEVWRTDRRFK